MNSPRIQFSTDCHFVGPRGGKIRNKKVIDGLQSMFKNSIAIKLASASDPSVSIIYVVTQDFWNHSRSCKAFCLREARKELYEKLKEK